MSTVNTEARKSKRQKLPSKTLKRKDAPSSTPPSPTEPTTEIQVIGPQTHTIEERPPSPPPAPEVNPHEPKEELFLRLPASVNPKFLDHVDRRGIIRYERPIAHRLPTNVFVELRVTSLRNAFKKVIADYLKLRYQTNAILPITAANTEIGTMSVVVADACMAAIYAKLRTIHKQVGTYGTRYNAPASFTKDMELPLPFADAIHNLGMFGTKGEQANQVIIPTYPEGTRYEGRSQEDSTLISYKTYSSIFQAAGIPVRSIDTRLKSGSAWWTIRYERTGSFYDLACSHHPMLYSNHSAILSTMFLNATSEEDPAPVQIITHPANPADYGLRMRCLSLSVRQRSFAALCQSTDDEWTTDPTML